MANPYAEPVRVPIPAAEAPVDARLVRRLLADQLPDLAGRPVRHLGTGWDTEVYRLGDDLVVRMPRRELGATLLAREVAWLPHVAPGLPLAVSAPVATGGPGLGYPWLWAVCRYVPGRPLGAHALTGAAGARAADVLAGFLRALHRPAPAEAPRSGFRGVALEQRAPDVQRVMAAAPRALRPGLRRAWDQALAAGPHLGPDLWLHGDLHGLNVLAACGRITGIIDFGDLCAGDPATDLAVGWLTLDAPARDRLACALGVDAEAWQRGRGWAVLLGLMFLAHSDQVPQNAEIGLRALAEVLA